MVSVVQCHGAGVSSVLGGSNKLCRRGAQRYMNWPLVGFSLCFGPFHNRPLSLPHVTAGHGGIGWKERKFRFCFSCPWLVCFQPRWRASNQLLQPLRHWGRAPSLPTHGFHNYQTWGHLRRHWVDEILRVKTFCALQVFMFEFLCA